MKTLLLCCCLFASALIAQAQQKPSRAETISFLNYLLVAAKDFPRGDNELFSEMRFPYSTSLYYRWTNNGTEILVDITKIPWDNFDKIVRASETDARIQYLICFKTSFTKRDRFGNFDKRETTKYFPIVVLKEKAESAQKAVLRLAEIASEENKDPFK